MFCYFVYFNLMFAADVNPGFDECQQLISDELIKDKKDQDVPKLRRLLRVSHGVRRETLKGLSTITAVTDKFPLLAQMKFVS